MSYYLLQNFYVIGWDKNRTFWKVLKIDRSDTSELKVHEDPTIYTENECSDLLSRINEGNKSAGGLKLVTNCYGIVGFIKFLGPHYMLLITKRKKVGSICGHTIYTITRSEMIPIPNSSAEFNMDSSKSENRYKKLLWSMDLTKDFYFSYSYNIMLSLQKNISNHDARSPVYETLFVWNEFLSRAIRNQISNTMWTVALVYGFFRQVKLSVSGRDFRLTLIARRSRHYAGTRYLKRGVNEKGRVANDVETEQIVFEDVSDGSPIRISSVVQIRGSIPLFWSQETSRLNIRPNITLLRNDENYAATKLHFDNLVYRYGNPIIILNLIKAREKKPRESILLAEFAHAIDVINRDLTEEDHLRFLHWDLSKYSKKKAKNALDSLRKVAANALDMTGFSFCHIMQSSRTEEWLNIAHLQDDGDGDSAEDILDRHSDEKIGENSNIGGLNIAQYCKPLIFQQGVLRTNCIDCLDRTNVAQYCYGLVALGHQLHVIGFVDVPNIDFDSPLADDLMKLYEAMGDTLAFQYGGSAAHNKIFSERRGQPKALTQSQEFLRTLQRYYSNAYMDAEKQDAINVFLGHFRPQQGRPALWELDSDQHFNVGRHGLGYVVESPRSIIKRSRSDGSILSDSKSEQIEDSCQPNISKAQGSNKGHSESSPEISTCESRLSYSRYKPLMNRTKLIVDNVEREDTSFHGSVKMFNRSNFLNMDWLSSSANSCEEEAYERSALIGISSIGKSTDTVSNSMKDESTSSESPSISSTVKDLPAGDASSSVAQNNNVLTEFSESFAHWVEHGGLLFL
ncbi:hypothetical protein Leryth_018582 [Lithospermum erythrorhizon]|nr:hypothetical protein Leryth_018582 [Lithospermum erythrorhizon]